MLLIIFKKKNSDTEVEKKNEKNERQQMKNGKRTETQGRVKCNFETELHASIKEGSYYFCVICNRSPLQKNCKLFNSGAYKPVYIRSFDTFALLVIVTFIKGIPCQLSWCEVDELPHEIKLLNLEKVLISKRIQRGSLQCAGG